MSTVVSQVQKLSSDAELVFWEHALLCNNYIHF